MNHLTTILLSDGILLTGIAAAAQDMIIFRDGRVKSVKIIQTNNDKTLYRESADKHAEEEYVENTKVFMLKFKTRGNVVFNNKGERILATSEPLKIPKDAVVVYYKDGREVPAYNLTMDANNVSFRQSKKEPTAPIVSKRSEVFMVRYPDGTRDILTNLAVDEEREREEEEARLTAMREAAVADSIQRVNAADEAATSTTPRKATIVTKKGVRMKVWICSDSQSMVSYKKTNDGKAAIFKMSKSKIKEIIY